MIVIKRDGNKEKFNIHKIESAVKERAYKSTGKDVPDMYYILLTLYLVY